MRPRRPSTLAYRPEIDGLRAIAVAVVIGFHGRLPGLSGGFIGVDVFFVVSGYLITRLILQERRTGRFSLARFYERRARRILLLAELESRPDATFVWLDRILCGPERCEAVRDGAPIYRDGAHLSHVGSRWVFVQVSAGRGSRPQP